MNYLITFRYGPAVLLFLCLPALVLAAGPTPPAGTIDLALHKKVSFAPAPNYWLTRKGDTDSTDLTDGKTTQRKDQEIWRESSSVGWRYPGRVNLSVDLGKLCNIDEIAMRFCGGSPHSIEEMPPWVEVFVSKDGQHYNKVGSYWRWHPGDFKKFGIPRAKGKAWVYGIPFKNINATARYVGIRFYGTGTTSSDELYVFGTPVKKISAAENKNKIKAGAPSGFSVTQPQLYFNKPYLKLATNVTLPVPVGMTTPGGKTVKGNYQVTLQLSAGIKLVSGQIGQVNLADAAHQKLKNGANRYTWKLSRVQNSKVFGRLFISAPGWKNGQSGVIDYQYGNSKWQSPKLSIAVKAVAVPPAPRLKQVMAGMGWWGTGISQHWPNILKVYRILGLNTFNVFSGRMPDNKNSPRWKLLEKARHAGFFISDIGEPYYLYYHRKVGAVPKITRCQFPDGSVSGSPCPSYRGKYFQKAVQLLAHGIADVKPNFVALDIEPWGWRGPVKQTEKCTRCQASFKKSGLSSHLAWQLMMGRQIWSSFVNAAHKANQAAGGKPFEIGSYDFRSYFSFKHNDAYQNVFSFHQLYPKLLSMSQPSIYMSYQPYDLVHLGKRIRIGRKRIGHNDIMPWISPGDSGVFAGKAFKWGILECYLNGASGIWFWSSRMWDSEDLIAYNKALRAIAPIEPLVVHGDLANRIVQVIGAGHVSAKRGAVDSGRRNQIAILASDYFHDTDGKIQLKVNVPAKSTLKDLLTGKVIQRDIQPGQQTITLPLNNKSARLVCLMPGGFKSEVQ